jgi:antitoxin ParD1/3/4
MSCPKIRHHSKPVYSENLSLTPELESWVDERVRSGHYASASEVIREALRMLEEQEPAKKRPAKIRQKIDRGLDQLNQGRGVHPEDARSQLRAARKK